MVKRRTPSYCGRTIRARRSKVLLPVKWTAVFTRTRRRPRLRCQVLSTNYQTLHNRHIPSYPWPSALFSRSFHVVVGPPKFAHGRGVRRRDFFPLTEEIVEFGVPSLGKFSELTPICFGAIIRWRRASRSHDILKITWYSGYRPRVDSKYYCGGSLMYNNTMT